MPIPRNGILKSEPIDLTSYSRQRDKLREELMVAQIDHHAEAVDELDVQGILAFAECIVPRASDLGGAGVARLQVAAAGAVLSRGNRVRRNSIQSNRRTAPLVSYLAPSESADEKVVSPTSVASLYVGAEGTAGDVIVRDKNNRERIRLDGGEGDIRVRNGTGNSLLLFGNTNAAVYIGGDIHESDRLIRDHDSKARIKVDGSQGDIVVRRATGANLLRVESTDATLCVGGKNNPGDIIVRDDAGAKRFAWMVTRETSSWRTPTVWRNSI